MRTIIALLSIFLISCVNAQSKEVDRPALTTARCRSGTANVLKVPKGTIDFSVSMDRPDDADVYINSNFFNSAGPIGEVIIDRKRHSPRKSGGGYFFVKNGVPNVSAYAPPRNPEHSTQSILVAINDGSVNTKMLKRAHAREATYRSLIGIDKRDNLYIIASGRGCLTTIEEIIDIGRSYKIQEAILPDAGSSVDYRLSDGDSETVMKAMPGLMKKAMGIEEPKSYIVGKFNRSNQ